MTKFIANSKVAKELVNSANLLKSLAVNTLIIGDEGTGKKTLAKDICDNAKVYKAKVLQDEISSNVFSIDDNVIIIDSIEEITNIDSLLDWHKSNNIRIIATSKKKNLNAKLQELFSITLEIPPLEERKEDIKPLANKFSDEAKEVFGDDIEKPSKLLINISKNAHSLRKSIYFSYLFESIGENEIMMLLEKYMSENFQGENNYRDFLYLFEAPLLKSAQKEYKSQLQMAKFLGLNRITLRKKLEQYKDLI